MVCPASDIQVHKISQPLRSVLPHAEGWELVEMGAS